MNNIKTITPAVSAIKTGTPAIKVGNDYIVGGIGGNFIPGGGSSGGTFKLYKVTAYTPHLDPVAAQTGYTIALSPDDHSAAGTYSIISGLLSAVGKARRYACGSHYLVCVNTAEERWATNGDDSTDCTWYLTTTNDPSCYMGDYDYNMPASDFPTGSWELIYMEEITSQSTTEVQTSPATPLVPQVLRGVLATDYDTSTKVWTFNSSSDSLSGFEKTPKTDNIYCSKSMKLIGNIIAYGGSLPIDEYTQMLICPKLADGSFSNLVTGSTASGTMTNVGVTLNADNDMVFASDNTYLHTARANMPTGSFTDSAAWTVDLVMQIGSDTSSHQFIIGNFGANSWYPEFESGNSIRGSGTPSMSYTLTAGNWLIFTVEHLANGTTNYYLDGTYSGNNSSVNFSSFDDVGFWSLGTDGRYFRGAGRCVRIRNNAPYQGTSFTSDLEFLKDL